MHKMIKAYQLHTQFDPSRGFEWYFVPIDDTDTFLRLYDQRCSQPGQVSLRDHMWMSGFILPHGPEMLVFKYPGNLMEANPEYKPSLDALRQQRVCKFMRSKAGEWFIVPVGLLPQFRSGATENVHEDDRGPVPISSPIGITVLWPIRRCLLGLPTHTDTHVNTEDYDDA